MLRSLLLLLSALLFAPTTHAVDEKDLLPIDQAFALSAKAVSRNKIEFTWKIAPGYYLYRHRMSVNAVESNFKTNPLELPEGHHKKDQFFGDVQTYRNEVIGIQTGAAADGVTSVSFLVKYQGCADVGVCYPPHKKTITVVLPAAAKADAAALNLDANKPAGLFGDAKITTESLPLPAEQAFQFEAIVDTSNQLLLRFTPAPGYYLYRDKTKISIVSDGNSVAAGDIQWPPAKSHKDEHFGDVAVFFDLVEAKLPLQLKDAKAKKITLKATFIGCQENGICYPPMKRDIDLSLPAGGKIADAKAERNAEPFNALAWIQALLLALGGGLILNLMPCVLPILSLKALSLVEGADDNRNARRKALWYSLGVMISFALVGVIAIGLRHAGLALGWGFQLQQPVVVAVLALVMLAVGLSLSGVFQIGAGLAGVGQKLTESSGYKGDFFTGVLAVVVASPCTAPMMGGALAFAFAASPFLAISVFLALGLGLALPFLMIAYIPALAKLLPRPGAWMETLKQVLAFPMYLTAAWLVSVLAAQRGSMGVLLILAGATALAFALWLWERSRYSDKKFSRVFALVGLIATAYSVFAIYKIEEAPAKQMTSETHAVYSAEALASLQKDNRQIFVNMTADWCISCKANEAAVFSRPAFKKLLEETNTVYMVGDYTNVDPEITKFLEHHKAVGVPLYVVYSPKNPDGKVLPVILSPGIVDKALREEQQ
ncbi:MAG: protein-disulfide reductase DsbD family protein [Arenimonas sp.]